jgi:hypothetical protein
MQAPPTETVVTLQLKTNTLTEEDTNGAIASEGGAAAEIERNNGRHRPAIDTDHHNFGKGLNLKRFDVTICRCSHPTDRTILGTIAIAIGSLYFLEQLLRSYYGLPYGLEDVEGDANFAEVGADGSLMWNQNLLFMVGGALFGTRIASFILTQT